METLAMIFYALVFTLAIGGLSVISFYLHKNIDKNSKAPISKFPSKLEDQSNDIEHNHSKVA